MLKNSQLLLFCRNSINNNNTNSWAELEKNQLHRCIGQSVRTTEVYGSIKKF